MDAVLWPAQDPHEDLAIDRQRPGKQAKYRVPGPAAGDLAVAALSPAVPLDLDLLVRVLVELADSIADLRLELKRDRAGDVLHHHLREAARERVVLRGLASSCAQRPQLVTQ